ncbi:SIMPL domain-containing protein [Nitrososphaera viennensis]|nr:SIMPL domain-containing protein [Nitrososphaera viennensis]UVS69838.1 SIMPL domain-containing protein [Nitrososphaera viennensis]
MNNFSRKKLPTIAIVLAVVLSAAVASTSFFVAGTPLLLKNDFQKAYSQDYAALPSGGKPATIKVTGEASTTITPDQATIIINAQTEPGELSSVLSKHQARTQQIAQAVREAAGDRTTIAFGQQSLNPYYSNTGVPASNNVTFNVYASVAVQTNIDRLPGLVSKLADAGFGFESVYIDPSYSAAILRKAESAAAGSTSVEVGDGAENQTRTLERNPITVGVSLNTKPDVLTKSIAEYEQKYRSLLAVLRETGISEDQVRQNNLNIYPFFYGSNQNAGYSMYTQIIVRTDAADIEKVTAAVKKMGGANVENVYLSASDAAIDQARKELGKQAFDSAKSRAEEMAQSLGLQVNGIVSIEAATDSPNPYGGLIPYRGVHIIQPYYPNISGEISKSVTVEFELGKGGDT